MDKTTIQRAYSLLDIKAVDEKDRVIRGIATTPEVDRYGDIVDPLGVRFKNPLPLLWQHMADKPVGTAKFEKPTKSGIAFEATLPYIAEEGTLRNRIEEAWQSLVAKLVRGVSIGFRALEYSFMDGGGIRFQECEVLELSLVTVPANSDCTVQTIKAIATKQRAALGQTLTRGVRLIPPGVSGEKPAASRGVKLIIPETKK